MIDLESRLTVRGFRTHHLVTTSNGDRKLAGLLTTAIARLDTMHGDVELLVHAFAGAVVLAAAEEARATPAEGSGYGPNEDLRRAENKKMALQRAWSEARGLADNLADRLKILRELHDKL